MSYPPPVQCPICHSLVNADQSCSNCGALLSNSPQQPQIGALPQQTAWQQPYPPVYQQPAKKPFPIAYLILGVGCLGLPILFFLIILFFSAIVSERKPVPVASQPAAITQTLALPEYQIVEEKTQDIPIKTQVEQHILVSGNISEKTLEALLRQQFDSIMKRRGFKYQDAPTNVYIYTYDKKEKAEAGQGLWLAMLQMSPLDDGKPKVTVDKELIALIGKKPEEKFGLSVATRKRIFYEIAEADYRAEKEAEKIAPQSVNLDKNITKERELAEKYKKALMKKYNLTQDQLSSIMVEGVKNKWPRPKL